MERLTEKCWRNLDPWECCGQDNFCKRGCHDKGGCANGCIVPNLYCKLAKYEDAEEQGLLLRLPCKVGDTVWDIDYSRPCAYTITGYSFGIAEDYIDEPVKEDEIVYYYTNSIGSIVGSFASSEIGKTVFLTKEKAEQALKQMGE